LTDWAKPSSSIRMPKVPFHIKVVDTDEVNAFAFPGGILCQQGSYSCGKERSEAGRVMAHEISHVTARHATARMSKGQYLQFAAIPALFVGVIGRRWGFNRPLGLGINLELMGVTRNRTRSRSTRNSISLNTRVRSRTPSYRFFEKKCRRGRKAKPGLCRLVPDSSIHHRSDGGRAWRSSAICPKKRIYITEYFGIRPGESPSAVHRQCQKSEKEPTPKNKSGQA